MKKIFIMLICAMSLVAYAKQTPQKLPQEPNATTESTETHAIRHIETTNLLTNIESKVREAAVKVYAPGGGHGSGGLIKYKGLQLILTAHHVTDGALGQMYFVSAPGEAHRAILIYKDPLHDIALLYLPNEFEHYSPMKWKVSDDIAPVGHNITYSGYPSWHNLMSFRGHVAGYEVIPEAGQQIILQTYGFFGSSGSVIYDSDGKIVGVLWGVDIQRNGVHENIIWVAPIQNLNMDLALGAFCNSIIDKPRACR